MFRRPARQVYLIATTDAHGKTIYRDQYTGFYTHNKYDEDCHFCTYSAALFHSQGVKPPTVNGTFKIVTEVL